MKQLVFAIVFLAGAALGFVSSSLMNGKQAKAPEDNTPKVTENQDDSRIKDLESQLAIARAEIKRLGKLTEDAEAAAKKAQDDAPKPPDFAFNENTDLNEEMKKRMSDDQFVAATNAIADLRARLTAKAKGRMDFISSVDASKMSAADREKHEKYLGLLKQRTELMSKMKGGFPDMESMQKMMELQVQMGPAAKEERAVLVNEVVRELGYVGDDAEVVNETITSIYDSTSGGGLMGNIEEALEAMGPNAMQGMPGMPGPGGNANP